MDLYTNNNIPYRLTKKELKKIDSVWDFIYDFQESYLSRYSYRTKIFEKIKNKYTIDEFCLYESIVEKMYWRLINTLELSIERDSKIFTETNVSKNIEKKILITNKNIKNSSIKKTYIITDKRILYKYKYPDDLDIIASSIMINRSTYETILLGHVNIFDLVTEPYHNIVEFDYPFPNISTIMYQNTDNDTRLKNIKKMYGYQ